ncbi:MAG: DeoR family transcriptional regulator [Minisyncoccia bacterium]
MRNFNSKLKNRQKGILEKLVKSYIQKGEPIASQFLVVHYNFNVSPATIRNDFQELTEEGYLYKFHISGGRVPTDKAWRFFVDILSEKNIINSWMEKWDKIIQTREESRNNWEEIINFISNTSQSLSFCYIKESDEVKKCGLKYIFSSILTDLDSALELVPKIAESLETLDEQVKNIKIKNEPLVFIGRDNPFIKSDEFSAVLAQTHRSKNILGILGNKRMPYDKNISLLKAVAERR